MKPQAPLALASLAGIFHGRWMMRLFRHEVRAHLFDIHDMQARWGANATPDNIAKALDEGFHIEVAVPGLLILSRRVWFWEKPWREFRQGFSTEYKRARSTP